MPKPKVLIGTSFLDESDNLYYILNGNFFDPYTKNAISESLRCTKLDVTKPIFMEDDNNVLYPIYIKEILEQIARRQLDRALDQLIASVNYEE